MPVFPVITQYNLIGWLKDMEMIKETRTQIVPSYRSYSIANLERMLRFGEKIVSKYLVYARL